MAERTVLRLYDECRRGGTDEFYSPERFRRRFDGYAGAPGFQLVLATDTLAQRPIGQVFGYPLPADARWWHGLRTPYPADLTDETGFRTFAVNELMVAPGWRRRGVARTLHDHLLTHRHERRATLLVSPENSVARTAYESWGWVAVARLQPFPDAPLYHAMILEPLPESRQGRRSTAKRGRQ